MYMVFMKIDIPIWRLLKVGEYSYLGEQLGKKETFKV